MTRSSWFPMVLATLVLGARPLAAQVAPIDWNHRTMTGASLEVLTAGGPGLLMAALRTTNIGDRTVMPDFTLGVGYTSGVLLSAIDLGIGTSVGGQSGLFTISIGPSLLAAVAAGNGGSGGAAAIAGFHGRAGWIFPVSADLGIRFDAGRHWYLSQGQTYGLWTLGFGVTGLGTPHRTTSP